jgi:membrane associated rhomboid family serine protease
MWQERSYASPSFGSYVTRAPATWWVIGVTTAAYVIQRLTSAWAPAWAAAIAEYGPTSLEGWRSFELWRPVTYLLLHANVQHILWNMLFLAVAGSLVEPQIGSRAFLRLYVASGIVGALSPVFHGSPTIGASGAINGVLVAVAVLMPDVVILFMFLIPMKIKWVVAIFLAIDVLNVISADGGRTDSICHVLGAATGFAIAFIGPRFVTPWLARRRQEKVEERRRTVAEQQVDEERELDRLLEKISREGMPSLTEDERRFLKRVSGKYQNARRD